MPFPLANLPKELLTLVLSHLILSEPIARLYGCGNRHLMRSITNGAVTHIQLRKREPLRRTLNFIPTLRLDSISLEDCTLVDTHLRALIRVLPSTLRGLKLTYRYSDEFWLTDPEFASSPPAPLAGFLAHVSTQSKATWVIKESFPCLELLHLNGGDSSTLDIFTMINILCGLPETLTTLSLGFLESCEFDFYALLPPRLTCLGGDPKSSRSGRCLFFDPGVYARVIPSQHLAKNHLRCLSTLSLDLKWTTMDPTESELRAPAADYGRLGSLWSPKALTELWFPPTLTCLYLQYKLKQTPLLRALPATLETLSLILANGVQMTVEIFFETMRYLPPSLRSLYLEGIYLHSNPEVDAYAEILPSLSSLKLFHLRGALPASILRLLMVSAANTIEDLSLIHNSSPLTLELLEICGRRLISLETLFDAGCFPEGDGPYPLHSFLPQLCTLRVRSVEAQSDFNFAAIPPTVTDFDIARCSTAYLHRLPPNVTKLDTKLEISTKGEYYHYLSAPVPQDPPQRLIFREYGEIHRIDCVVPVAIFNGFLGWPKKMIPLPNTLTDLTTSARYLDASFSPDKLPHLTRLELTAVTIRKESTVDLEPFLTLLELIAPLSLCYGCPPNLTSLSSEEECTEIFGDLPVSLTHLKCAGLERTTILHLPSLRTLEFGPPLNVSYPPNLELERIPTTITSLSLQGGTVASWKENNFKALFDRFSHLESLAFASQVTRKAFELADATRPPHTSIKSLIRTIQDDSNEKHRQFHDLGVFFEKDAQWRDLTSIECGHFTQPGFDGRAFSAFHVSSAPALNPLGLFYFPPMLTKMVLSRVNGPQNLVESLPVGMTHLEIPNWEICHAVDTWPPALTYLQAKFNKDVLEANLRALPASLTHLGLENETFPSELFHAIPPQVQRLAAFLEPEDRQGMLQYAKERRNLVWVIPKERVLHVLTALSTSADFGPVIDEIAQRLHRSWKRQTMEVDGDEERDQISHGVQS